jgi:diguanylate cyclase (GGDEF)-like protein
MALELERLHSPLGLLGNFPPALELRFRQWLDVRMHSLLHQYLWALGLLYTLLVALDGPLIRWFSPASFSRVDSTVCLLKALALGVVLLLLAVAVRAEMARRYFRYGAALASTLLLVILAVGVQAYTDPANRLMGMTNLWICATVVFATGLQLPATCLLIALCSLPLVLVSCVLLGLTDGLVLYSLQLMVGGTFVLAFSHVMARVHRQVFLQEGILLHDKERLLVLSEQMALLSLKDPLTGVANRRRFDEVLAREWARARRQHSSLALLFIDVDHFKAYNDHYGHQAGDDCLRAVAFVLEDAGRRPGDLVARYGGEEFVLLLPDTQTLGAADAAARIRSFLAQASLPHAAVTRGQVTVSIGVALCTPSDALSPADLLAVADQAVYRAKARGRDAIEVAPA